MRTPRKDEYKRVDDGTAECDGSMNDEEQDDEDKSEELRVAGPRPCSIRTTGEEMLMEGLVLALAVDPSGRQTVAMVGRVGCPGT